MKWLLLLLTPCLLAACGNPTKIPEPTLSVQGSYTDTKSNTVTLGPDNVYVQQPHIPDSHWYEVNSSLTQDQSSSGYLVAQNRSNLGQANELGETETVFFYSRFDWQLFAGDLYYCHTVDNAPDTTAALQSTAADHSSQGSGCRGGGWIQITKS